MICAGCNNIETHPVRLVDGTIVCSTCEAWRHECEARAILRLPSLNERRAWLDALEKKRGKEARDALQVTMGAIWQAERR